MIMNDIIACVRARVYVDCGTFQASIGVCVVFPRHPGGNQMSEPERQLRRNVEDRRCHVGHARRHAQKREYVERRTHPDTYSGLYSLRGWARYLSHFVRDIDRLVLTKTLNVGLVLELASSHVLKQLYHRPIIFLHRVRKKEPTA